MLKTKAHVCARVFLFVERTLYQHAPHVSVPGLDAVATNAMKCEASTISTSRPFFWSVPLARRQSFYFLAWLSALDDGSSSFLRRYICVVAASAFLISISWVRRKKKKGKKRTS